MSEQNKPSKSKAGFFHSGASPQSLDDGEQVFKRIIVFPWDFKIKSNFIMPFVMMFVI